MAIQVKNGKAFEWSVAQKISEITKLPIAETPESHINKEHYLNLDVNKKIIFDRSAAKAVEHIVQKEKKKLIGTGFITFNPDSAGKQGDVRDVLIRLEQNIIGFSCKTNHEALKHSRLSKNIDFVLSWGLHKDGCSTDYWNKVSPIFKELEDIAKKSNKKAKIIEQQKQMQEDALKRTKK